jgi:hypothetical protein
MNRLTLSLAAAGTWLAALILSIVMAFVVDHGGFYGHPSYQVLLTFDKTVWWLQFFGGMLSAIGCFGMSAKLPERMALVIGFSGILFALLATLWFGSEILNVHSWTIALLMPLFLAFLNFGVLSVVGLVRLIRAGQSAARR